MKTKFGVIILSLNFVACSLIPERSYQAQMEEEDDGFMVPYRDFPVVSGDSGAAFRNRREILKRTPAESREESMHEYLLEDELSTLEENLSDSEKSHYRQYEHKLTSVSEKIYFLKLDSAIEREEYLESKGISTESPVSRSLASLNSFEGPSYEITRGATKTEVLRSYGQPYSVEVAGDPKYENERWAYKRKGYVDYVYFESGRVEGIAKSR